ASTAERIARVFAAIRSERRGEAEAAEIRAEVNQLGRLVVDAVAGAVCRPEGIEAGVREVEVRRVCSEDGGRAGHQVTHLAQGFRRVAEAEFAEAAAALGLQR